LTESAHLTENTPLTESTPLTAEQSRTLSGHIMAGHIMVVDDNSANLKLLEDMLVLRGHEVRSFPLGRLALASAARTPPDLILLDIDMPEMNGYEVCGRLKSTPALAAIPVIFLSALSESSDKVKAFHCGAADYISKPFQFDEVHARVETHLALYHLQKGLLRQNEVLEDAVAARTGELAEANEKLTILDESKDAFLTLISHEFRTPLNGLLGVGELLLERMTSTEEDRQIQGLYQRCRRRILSLLDDALIVTQIDVNGDGFRFWDSVSLNRVLSRALDATTEFAGYRGVALTPAFARQVEIPVRQADIVQGDEDLLVRAFHALLEIAVIFSSKDGSVLISDDILPDSRTIVIESDRGTIPGPALAKFFDLFSVDEVIVPDGDIGLGAAVAYRILSLFGGSVSVANRDRQGIRLTVSLKNRFCA
jgi:two-component system, sensor histidine kinase and response regulator